MISENTIAIWDLFTLVEDVQSLSNTIYSQACLMWPSKGTVKYGHIRQVVA
jgi:hypothetical protein